MGKGKSSAKSKGFRAYHAKKPFLTKKEWIILAVAAVVLIAGFVVVVTANFDGALRVVNGVVQQTSENSLIVNGGTTSHPRYYPVGGLLELPDGWSMELGSGADVNTPSYNLLPPEDSGIDTVAVTASGQDYHTLAQAMATFFANASTDEAKIDVSELAEDPLNGRAAYTFTYQYESQEDDSGDAAEDVQSNPRFMRKLNAYVQIPQNRTLLVYVTAKADTAEALPSAEDMRPYLDAAIAAVSIEEK